MQNLVILSVSNHQNYQYINDMAQPPRKKPSLQPGEKLRAAEKLARIPIKIEPSEKLARKPDWIRVRMSLSPEVNRIKKLLRENNLVTVCEEASCPNLAECFSHGTATFMIMGEICTRRCPFCDVAHGRPLALDESEPKHLANTIAKMQLRYVVITSVDRDDLLDGGAKHFIDCIRETRALNPDIQIETLVPDFRGRLTKALDILITLPPDVFNHNLETVPRLYPVARPGSDYQHSLQLLKEFKQAAPNIPTKSGLMLGLGETNAEIIEVMKDLRNHDVDMLTLGQYLQPSRHHLPVIRYVHPDEFTELKETAEKLGFSRVASGPLVRSSYHADEQAKGTF